MSRIESLTPYSQILIVDDRDSRDIVALQLQMLGYNVIEARSGEEAIEKALGQIPNLIIMDLRLPGISGIEAAMRLKNNAATRNIPVVAHTAWDKLEFKDMAKNAGMVEFLVKPVSTQQWNKIL